MIQPIEELEKWHSQEDPWGYRTNPADAERKRRLLAEIPDRSYSKTLDIGCGQGFVTLDLPGKAVVGVDISQQAIDKANEKAGDRHQFKVGSILSLPQVIQGSFDLVLISGVLYPQYIGKAFSTVYQHVDSVLKPGGILVTTHIDDWYLGRFPYGLLTTHFYNYREYTHRLEVYAK